MEATITPQIPSIFIGEPFTIELQINNPKGEVTMLSAQIVGNMVSPKQTQKILQDVLKRNFSIDQKVSTFSHTMSSTSQLSGKFTGKKTFAITIFADGIPPSYTSSLGSITYELLLTIIVNDKVDKSHRFPLTFIGNPSQCFTSQSMHDGAKFSIASKETNTRQSSLSSASPNKLVPDVQKFAVLNGEEYVSILKMPLSINAGRELYGYIDMRKSKVQVMDAFITVWKIERCGPYEEKSKVAQNRIPISGFVVRNFAIPIPAQTCTAFQTDFISVSYIVEFLFNGQSDSWKWESPIKVFPAEFSLTKERIPE